MSPKKSQINKIIDEVNSNPGKAVVCLRHIIVPNIRNSSKNFYYLEAGIIDGEYKSLDDVGLVREVSIPSRREGDAYRYIYSLNSGIPLISSLSTKSFSRPSLNYKTTSDGSILWDEEKGIAFGKYEFGSYELFPATRHFARARNARQILPLENISIYVGDTNIQESMLSKEVPELEITSFLNMINNTGGLKDEISSFRIDNQSSASQGLIKRVANLCDVYSSLEGIKDAVLESEYVHKSGLKGKWWEWTNPKEVHTYLSLKSQANKLIFEIVSLMKESRDVGFEKLPFVSGECLGFPSRVDAQQYFQFVSANVLPPVKKALSTLD